MENLTLDEALTNDNDNDSNKFHSLNVSKQLEKVSLDEATNSEFNSIHMKVESVVKIFRTGVSGFLAVSLWIAFICTGLWHTYMVKIIVDKTLSKIENNEKEIDFEAIDKSRSIVADTAKTLYAVISPLATGITGFYFVVKSDEKKSKL